VFVHVPSQTVVAKLSTWPVAWDEDLYGQTLRVALVDFIRPEMKFSGLDQLKAQIAADGAAARQILAPT